MDVSFLSGIIPGPGKSAPRADLENQSEPVPSPSTPQPGRSPIDLPEVLLHLGIAATYASGDARDRLIGLFYFGLAAHGLIGRDRQ